MIKLLVILFFIKLYARNIFRRSTHSITIADSSDNAKKTQDFAVIEASK